MAFGALANRGAWRAFIKFWGADDHNFVMHEIELKFQVPPERRKLVDAAVAGRTPLRRTRLQAAYVDTPERLLARAGLALRVRREGRDWVQTLKGATADDIARLEHNVRLGAVRGAGETPSADPARHAGTPAGDRLLKLLAAQPGAVLGLVYRTDILRRTRTLRVPQGRVELAFDEGRIQAGEAQAPVCELEIELLGGSELAVIDAARGWVVRYGLWLDTRSKAERGDLLARGETMAPARTAAAVVLAPELSPYQAWLRVLGNCAQQITANASQIASGTHGDAHVHQLRVGLRRLRSAVRLFEFAAPNAALGEAAAVLFRRLGAARDQAVIEGAFAADLAAALHGAGVQGEMPPPTLAGVAAEAVAAVRDATSQAFVLDLLAGAHAAAPDAASALPATSLKAALTRQLKRWHRQAVRAARGYATLDDEGRHRLRKRVKRLRYAVEFCAALFPRRAVRRYLRSLGALQERLGAINDTVAAMAAFRGAPDTDPRAWFAVGWLAARREVLVAQAQPDLRGFVKVRRFWGDD
jgi:triphosphatase